MTIFENSWGYKCPIPLENVPEKVRFITAELNLGSCVSPIKIKVQGFSEKPYPVVSLAYRPNVGEDDIRWLCDEKHYELILEGDYLQTALSVINNSRVLCFGKCIWEVPLYKLNTYEVKQFVSTYDIEAVGIEIINKDIAKMLVDDMPMYALRSILNFKQEDHPDSFDETTKVITCSVKI
jgi:hypothetical protein